MHKCVHRKTCRSNSECDKSAECVANNCVSKNGESHSTNSRAKDVATVAFVITIVATSCILCVVVGVKNVSEHTRRARFVDHVPSVRRFRDEVALQSNFTHVNVEAPPDFDPPPPYESVVVKSG